MDKETCLLTAHHANDQAETLLINLFRGAGITGLAAMPECREFATGHLGRPFLSCSRADLETYAKAHQLSWIEDPTNASLDFDRNFIRHECLPVIQSRWPGVIKTLGRTAELCGQAIGQINQQTEAHLAGVQLTAHQLSISGLLKLEQADRYALLREFIRRQGAKLPSFEQLKQIETDVLHCALGADPVFQLNPGVLRRYRDRLYYFLQNPNPTGLHYHLPWTGEPIEVPGWPKPVTQADLSALGIDPNSLDWSNISIRSREPGIICRPKGWRHAKPLKDCYQYFGVPTWERSHPLVFQGALLLAVIGVFS